MTDEEEADEPATEAESATHSAADDVTSDTATESEPEPAPPDEAADEDREMITVPATGGVARLLVKELQEGHVDEKWRHQLREALAVDESTDTGSLDARIEHLQTEVSDLAAYTDALEEFLNEKGAGRELIDSLENDVETLKETVDRIETRVDDGQAQLSELETTVTEMEADLEDLRADIEKQEEIAEEVDDLAAEIDEMADDIESIKEFRDRMSAVFNQQTSSE